MTEIPAEARRNEYAGLTERQIELLAGEAVDANDWETLSKLQVANLPSGAVPAGLSLRVQADFRDRR